jgi:Lon protease-like protein
VFNGGRLLGSYKFAELGELSYHSDCSYESQSPNNDDYRTLDEELLSAIKANTAKELDCHVCYDLMFDPVTTPCGHTFCRKCLARVLDHATHCPECRRPLPIPPSLERQASNVRLVSILLGLCPELVQLRAEAVAAEERGAVGELDTPIFICTLAFPSLPTYLHIFEPRYRLMIRRALEGNRRFGMVMYNRNREPQGDLGDVEFLEYGTMLEILTVRMLPDGRSLIESRGTNRFRVKAHGILDGYIVGLVDRVEDVSLAEEERVEAEETADAMQHADSSVEGEANQSELTDVAHLSTQQLLVTGLDFVNRMRANSAPWLHQRIIDAYGGPPDDPAQFPYWFASILPIADLEKYQLLKTTSVRERLKIVVRWIQRIERQRW